MIGVGAPTGNVEFFDGSTQIGAALLGSGGTASVTVSSLALGGHSITAQYQGDVNFTGSTSTAITQTIAALVATSTTVVSSANPGIQNAGIQFTATVTGAGAPTGNVEFFDGATPIGAATLGSDGTASIMISSLALGGHSITAQYQGDTAFAASTSASISQTIVAPTPTSSLVADLSGAAGSLPANVVGGVKLRNSVPIVISNSTNATVKGAITLALYATTDPTSIAGGTLIGMLNARILLRAEKSIKLRVRVPAFPATLNNGPYNVVAQLTDTANIATLAAYPSTVQFAAPFIAPAAALGAVAPVSILAGKHGSITLTVANMGNINAVGVLHVEIDPSVDGQTAIIGEILDSISRKVNIKPGGSLKIKLRLTAPSMLIAGQYIPLATVNLNGISTTAAGMAFMVT